MAPLPLISDIEELKQKFLEVTNYLFERGEMLKAFRMVCNAPSLIEEDSDVLNLYNEIVKRLEELSELQKYGSIGGKLNKSFNDPTNIEGMVKYKRLEERVEKLGLKKLVDIGCYTGWIGRNLSVKGISVHGIDIHPIILFYAGIASSGSLATFEYLPVEKLGFSHPLEYEGAILFDVLEHVFAPEIAVKSVEMSVKKGGWLFYNIPHPDSEHKSSRFEDPDTREHLHSFSHTRLRQLFNGKNNLEIETINNEEGSVNWWIQYQML